MRVLVDANVLISYLLNSRPDGPIGAFIDACLDARFELLLPVRILVELRQVVASKPYLRDRITMGDVDLLWGMLRRRSFELSEFPDNIPQISRDPEDDYLIVHAVLGRADYLVTGDKDLLVLGEIQNVCIVTPTEFIAIIES